MPVIGIDIKTLRNMIGTDIADDRLVKILEEMGCDVEGFAKLKRFYCLNCEGITEITEEEEAPAYCSICGMDFRKKPDKINEIDPSYVIRMDLLAVRPDIFDAGGLSRAVKGYLNLETGLKKYTLQDQQETIQVDDNIKGIRPYIVAAVIKNLTMDDDFIKTLMKLQENLHWALGRNRKHASIGVYDYDKLTGGFRYMAKEKDFKFVPLGYPISENNKIPLNRILKEHPKGVGYAFILEDYDQCPILMDSKEMVLSMPPIINSEDTKVTKATKNVIIDVTGPIERVINKALNILVTSIMEYQTDAQCEKVLIQYSHREVVTPDFSVEYMDLSVKNTSKLLGIELDSPKTLELATKMRHSAETIDEDNLRIGIANYRNDIIHPRDLMEDVAIAYGYHNITPSLIETMTVGQELEQERKANMARQILAGCGFLEITTLMLTCPESHYDHIGLKYSNSTVEIANPISSEQTILRTHLISGLLETFKLNIHNDLPQNLSEVGNVTVLEESETGAVEKKRAVAGIIGPQASYSEIKANFIAFMKEMDLQWKLEETEEELFIPGRGAVIVINNEKKGYIGEVHPQILENYHLVYPVALFEIEL